MKLKAIFGFSTRFYVYLVYFQVIYRVFLKLNNNKA
jgi:hypothetical protein